MNTSFFYHILNVIYGMILKILTTNGFRFDILRTISNICAIALIKTNYLFPFPNNRQITILDFYRNTIVG